MGDRLVQGNSEAPARMDQLQFFRFLAFLNVFLQHAPAWNFMNYPTFYATVSSISFFFILSGVVTGYRGYGAEQKPGAWDVIRYIAGKMLHLFPVYFLVMFISFVSSGALVALAHYRYSEVIPAAVQLLKNLLFLQSWEVSGYNSLAGITWFFSTIMFLYIFNLPAVYVINRVNKKKHANWIFIALMGCLFSLTVLYHYKQRFSEIMYYKTYVFPPARLGEYFLGILLGFLVRKNWSKAAVCKNKKTVFTIMECAVIIFWLRTIQAEVNTGPFYWGAYAVYWVLPNILLLFVFSFGFGMVSSIFRNRLLVRMGDITVNCVLLHVTVITIYCQITGLTGGGSRMVCVVSLGTCLLITVLMASLMSPKKS